jgi:FdhE protein
MPGGFLDRLLGRSPPPNPEVRDALAALDRAEAARPALAEALGTLRELLPALFDGAATDIALSLTPEQAAAKLAAGIPLLRSENVRLDVAALRRNVVLVCETLHRRSGDEAAQTLGREVQSNRSDLQALLSDALAGRRESADGLTASALRLAAYPQLAHLAATLSPLRDGAAWDHGECPTCGMGPLLGELRGLEQDRWLRCGWCATAWPFPRLACPWCGNRDHRTLGWLQAEEQTESGRLAVCDECRGGIKMLTTLTALSAPALLAADAATLHLNLAAGRSGFLVG